MKSRLLLVALLLALGSAMLLLSQDSNGTGKAREGETPAASLEPAPTPPGTLPPPEKTPLPRLEARPGENKTARLAAGAPNADATFDTTDARLVRLDVNLPAGVPADDELWLYGFAHPDSAPWRQLSRATASEQFVASDTPAPDLQQRGIVWARRRLSTNGQVELPFPPLATGATVVLFSHYVISAPVTFSLGTPPPTIEGTLGAWVTGTVLFPGTSILEDPRPEKLRLQVVVRRSSVLLTMGWQSARQVQIQPDSHYSLPRLPAETAYMAWLPAEGRLDFFTKSLRVKPGEHVTLDLPLEVGAAATGVVVDEDGAAIAGAYLQGSSPNSILGIRPGSTEGVMTGEDGSFQLAGLPPGKIELTAIANGWRTGDPTQIAVEAGQVDSDIRIHLSRGNQISGRVLGMDGRPVAGARVATREVGEFSWFMNFFATTDEEGAFLLRGLGGGPFDITARADHETTASGTGKADGSPTASPAKDSHRWQAFARAVPANATGVELILSPPQSIRGRVVDDTGSPIPSFRIESVELGKLSPTQPPRRLPRREDGTFELFYVHEGEWELRASSLGYFPAKEEGVLVRVPQGDEPIEIMLRRPITVSGIVVDPSGTPVPDAHAGYEWQSANHRSGFQGFPVGPEGRFEVEDVPPTGVTFIARSNAWAQGEPVLVSGEPGTKIENVILTLSAGGTIVGEVLDRAGRPDAGVGIHVLDSKGENHFERGVACTTDGTGSFRIEHVRAGRVHLLTPPNDESILKGLEDAKSREEIIALQAGQLRSATVNVVDGEEVRVRLRFPDRKPVRVTGTILEAGKPVPDAAILVLREGSGLLGGIEATRGDDDGRFDLTVDRPGNYVFRVRPPGKRSVPIPLHVAIPDVPVFSVKFELPTGVLAGVVLSPSGDPIGNMALRLRRPTALPGILDLDVRNTIVTSGSGHFRIEHVEPGSYALLTGGKGPPPEPRTSRYATAVLADIVLGPGEVRDDLVLRLSNAGTIDGRVRDEQGNTVSDAAIFVRDGAGELLANLATIRTDASGFFSYPGVPAGEAWVFARWQNLASTEAGPIAVHVDQSAAVDLILRAGCFLTVVFEVDGEPARATIRVHDAHGKLVSGAVTLDAFEKFYGATSSPREQRFGPLPPGSYSVSGEGPGGRTDTAEITVGGDEREFRVTLRAR